MSSFRTINAALLAASAIVLTLPAAAMAQPAAEAEFDLPAQSLEASLKAVSRQTGANILFAPDVVQGRQAPALKGRYAPMSAVERLIGGSGLEMHVNADQTVIIRNLVGDGARGGEFEVAGAVALSEEMEIVVTGTRVQGAPLVSPVITFSQQQMRDAGHTNLGDVIRSIPQNFNGGQNPGVTLADAAGPGNGNATSGSALNLRGLGADATLTLVNGRRMAYDGTNQATDISSIPLLAVERIEILADGASALYGSDAVAGVANVILMRDHDGLRAATRLATTTAGGGEQVQLSVLGGRKWGESGALFAYEFEKVDPITAGDRSYLSYMPSETTIMPRLERHSAILSAHYSPGSTLNLELFGIYNRRLSRELTTMLGQTTQERRKSSQNIVISSELSLPLMDRMEVSFGGTFAKNDTHHDMEMFDFTGYTTGISRGCYCNKSISFDWSANGPVLELPAGSAQMAIGGGYRKMNFLDRSLTSSYRSEGVRRNYNMYGEIHVPIISDSMALTGIHQLDLNGAIRYERYSDVGDIVTPKIGVIYEVVRGITGKISWGKSFKAPTLSQQHSALGAYLHDAITFGGVDYPRGSTIISLSGGGDRLRPERATTWTATVAMQPGGAPGLEIEASYFRIQYKDRIVSPIGAYSIALTNPEVADYITHNPTSMHQWEVVALSPQGLKNVTAAPYAPGSVVAIIDSRYINAAYDNAEGVDVKGRYVIDLSASQLVVDAQASWLYSQRKNNPKSPEFGLAGSAFNPPHFRGRLGGLWVQGDLRIAAFMSHVGPVEDRRSQPNTKGASMNTVDLTITNRFRVGSGPLKELELSVSVQNLLNKQPPYFRNSSGFAVNYDATNYSAIGRLAAVSISSKW